MSTSPLKTAHFQSRTFLLSDRTLNSKYAIIVLDYVYLNPDRPETNNSSFAPQGIIKGRRDGHGGLFSKGQIHRDDIRVLGG
jgi:hypothetical protein